MDQPVSVSHSIPSFIKKLYQMVSDESNSNQVAWTSDGRSIIIYNEVAFSNKILPKYYKHCNFSSFVRQLNMYNFFKVKESSDLITFEHEYFRKGDCGILRLIKRKPQKKKIKGETINRSNENRQKDKKRINLKYQMKIILAEEKNIINTQMNTFKEKLDSHEQIRKTSICESIQLIGDIEQISASPRISIFGDTLNVENYFSPINFDAFVCSHRNFLR